LGTYSYRFCISDLAGNINDSATITNVVVSTGSSSSWKTPQLVDLTASPNRVSAAIGSSISDVTVQWDTVPGASQSDIEQMQFNDTSWGSPGAVYGTPQNFSIISHGVGYIASNSLVWTHDGNGADCVTSYGGVTGIKNGNCRMKTGPSGTLVTFSNAQPTGTPANTTGVQFYNGSTWSVPTVPVSMVTADVAIEATNKLHWMLQDGVGAFETRIWDGTTLSSAKSIASGYSQVNDATLRSSYSGVAGAFFSVALTGGLITRSRLFRCRTPDPDGGARP
jgi:hypothetical protein